MKVLQIIGADLSKKTVDFATVQGTHLKVNNDLPGFRELLEWLNRQGINVTEAMIVMEHTGLCSRRLEQFLRKHQLVFSKVSPLAIKRSMGLVRGKTDKIDAKRIARYGAEKKDQLIASGPTSSTLERLKTLHSSRTHLVRTRAAHKNWVKEQRDNGGLRDNDPAMKPMLKMIETCDAQIRKLDEAIVDLMAAEKTLRNNNQLLQSIKGVGPVIALAVIIKTGNFTRFRNARKFACYCGTAPFENTSGTSIRGRTKVSHMADKQMKTLLDLAAKTAIQYDKELKEYYERRTMAGKSKMSTINVVRNKILSRMFAVIQRQTPYVNNYLQVA